MTMRADPDETGLLVLRRNLALYLEGATGIRYEDLLVFSEPLFQLFELDPRHTNVDGGERELEELSTLLSLLDLARLFWAYFLLEESQSPAALDDLTVTLLGPQPTAQEVLSMKELVQMLEDQWLVIAENAGNSTPPTGYSLPPFSELLEDYEHRHARHPAHDAHAASSADLPDALASFARPLFEEVNLDDPAEIDDALARAQAYWDLARTSGPSYNRRLARVVERFAGQRRNEDSVRTEAAMMTRRYRELFG